MAAPACAIQTYDDWASAFSGPGQPESGSGPGFSIARRIAAVHGMGIDIGRSRALGGLAVHVRCMPSSTN
jgi:two-component system sensor histidine kinase QseC